MHTVYMSQEMLQHCGKFLVFSSQFLPLLYNVLYSSYINVVITWSCCSIAANSLCLILSSFSCFIAATVHTCRRYLELLQHCGEFLVFSSQFFQLFQGSRVFLRTNVGAQLLLANCMTILKPCLAILFLKIMFNSAEQNCKF